MARRPRQNEERSMDSLMDAMTNVVGILLLILVVFSLELTRKIAENIAELPNVTQEELQELQSSRKKTLDNLKALQSTLADAKATKVDPNEAQQLALNLDQFEKENKELANKTSDLETLLAKSKELEPIKDEKQIRNTVAVTELNRLEQLLAEKPEIEEVAAREISLPDPRVADDQAFVYYVACKNQKVYVIGEPYELMNKMRNVIDRNYQDLAYSGTDMGRYTYTVNDTELDSKGRRQSLKVSFQARTRRDKEGLAFLNSVSLKTWGASSPRTMMEILMGRSEEAQETKKIFHYRKMRFDREKIKQFFESNTGKGDFSYVPHFERDRVRLEIRPNAEGGIPADKLNGSAYVEMIRQAKLNRKTIIIFYVAPDSFDIYLRARAYADNQQVAAGWRLWEGESITDYEPNKKRELVPYEYHKIPTDNYQKIAQFIGAKQAEVVNGWVDNFDREFAAIELPKDPKDESADEYEKRLREARIHTIRIASNDVVELFQAPLTASVSVRQTDVGVDLHPPYLNNIRTFEKRVMPTQVRPPRKPGSGAPAQPKPKPKSKLILD